MPKNCLNNLLIFIFVFLDNFFSNYAQNHKKSICNLALNIVDKIIFYINTNDINNHIFFIQINSKIFKFVKKII